jgi:hypothetical protein
MTDKFKLQLGDVIEIIAPTDSDINNKIFFIEYIDTDKLRLEEPNGSETILTLTDGNLDNKAITSVKIKSRAEEEGYARQNNLLIGVWIDIYFGGDLPITLTGKISNLEEDKIEITTFPENDVIFLDFAYKGLPEDFMIEKIQIRRAPEIQMDMSEQGPLEMGLPEGEGVREDEGAKADEDVREDERAKADEGEGSNILFKKIESKLPEIDQDEIVDYEAEKQKKISEQTRTFIFKADQIKFGDDLEEIVQFVDVPEDEQRFDIDKQLDDLLDDMLSTVPNIQRTDLVKNNIHKMIQRYKQLRDTFSTFDENGNSLMPKAQGANYKPIIDVLHKLEKQFYWILPVVKSMKKIYELGDEDLNVGMGTEDASILSFLDTQREITAIFDSYDQNEITNDTNKYTHLQNQLKSYCTPFLKPKNTEDTIITTKVNTTLNAIVDNMDDFISTVVGKPKTRKRFAVQTYNTGLTGLETVKIRGGSELINRINITTNDEMTIKSMLTLPEATVRFSRVNLPGTDILLKANLNLHFLNYWQLLKEAAKVSTSVIKDLSKTHEYEEGDFLKEIRNFKLLDTDENAQMNKEDKYKKFIEAIIPKTRFLFNMVKPYLTGNLSISDILAYLEPFMVYQADLTFMQYKEMNEYIQEKINEYRKQYINKSKEFGNMKGNQAVIIPSFIKILEDNQPLRDKVLSVYGFTDIIMKMSNAEFMKRIIDIDQGIFYNNAIAILSANLMIADGSRDLMNVDKFLNSANAAQTQAQMQATARAKKTKETGPGLMPAMTADAEMCTKIKVIAKRYIEYDEMMADNENETFFDKKYDTSPYSFIDKFKTDINMPPAEKIQFYIEKLSKMKGQGPAVEDNIRRDAAAIVLGKRLVETGDYAILETTDDISATLQYYIRQNEKWELDTSIDAETFADNMKMFCNLNEKCIEVKGDCKDQTTGASELKKHNMKLLLQEFDTSLDVNKDIIIRKIEDELNKSDARIESLKLLKNKKTYRHEALKIALGNLAEEREIIVSPNNGLLNIILGQNDMVKRATDISKFVAAFTREANLKNAESPYWLYCTKTNTKLLPTFLYKLAQTFLKKENYAYMLDKICAEQGTLSEDGDKWVDKHSGYTIKNIELNADEEYNEQGYKIISNALMEEDAGEVVLKSANVGDLTELNKAPVRSFVTLDAKKIYNVIDAMVNNMGIEISAQYDFIVRNVIDLLANPKVTDSKEIHEKKVAIMVAKGNTTLDNYETMYNSKLIYFTLAYILVAIQGSIPPIKTKITFPGCKKSFGGFPFDGSEDKKSVLYIACVANKMKSNASLPWSSIYTRNAATIAKMMDLYITKFILPSEEVQNKIKALIQYMESNPESYIPHENDVTNWTRFLPPLIPFKMAAVQDLGDVFKSHLLDTFRKKDEKQTDLINEIKSKMILFSFSIIDLIEKAVLGEQALLKTNTGQPFIENACCNAEDNKNTLHFFIKKEPEIVTLNNKVVRLSDLYDDTKKIVKAAFLFDPSNVRKNLKMDNITFSEETIYRAFIMYCKFNSITPLSDNLKAICHTKPDNFDAKDSIQESIRKLKGNARNYTEESLQQLLGIVNNSTKQPIIETDKNMSNIDMLLAAMEKIEEDNVRPSNFCKQFIDILTTFEIGALMEDTEQMRKLKNLMAVLNEDMQKQIIGFVMEEGQLVNARKNNITTFKQCIDTIVEFKETGDDMFLGKTEETGYKMVNFMKKTMRSLTKEFPNIIKNKVTYTNANKWLPKNLAGIHVEDIGAIISKHYLPLSIFYNDPQTNLIMAKFIKMSNDMLVLAENTLFYAPVELNNKAAKKNSDISSKDSSIKEGSSKDSSSETTNKQTYKYSALDLSLTTQLFKFYFLSAFMDLIALAKDQEILQVPLVKSTEDDDDDDQLEREIDLNVYEGNEKELAEKISKIIITFTDMIYNEKQEINRNYKGFMELVLRSKEKEKDTITDYLGSMTTEERNVENIFKSNKLGRWNRGQQKGLHTYDEKTYEQERMDMEQQAIREVKMNKNDVVTDMNRNIFNLELMMQAEEENALDRENNRIEYQGEDADYDEMGEDGDEMY